MRIIHLTKDFFMMYVDGFKDMRPLGKRLWLIVGIKLFIFLVVFKLLFFPNRLQTEFTDDAERSDHVINNLIQGIK